MQTTEWREDLAIEIFNEAEGVVLRMIVYEDETPLGHLDAGKYHFRLIVPSLGKGALEAHYAGAEVRLNKSAGGIKLYPSLKGAFDGNGASGRMTIPFQGARTLFAKMPSLDALEFGAYYFGAVKVKSGSDTVASVPLQVFRPMGKPVATTELVKAEESAPEGEVAAAADTTNEKEKAWSEAKASGEESPVKWISSARDWQKEMPLEFRAELAVYEALVAAGLKAEARDQAVGFLKRFPNRVSEFLAAARNWN
jgi:hypothetical protein